MYENVLVKMRDEEKGNEYCSKQIVVVLKVCIENQYFINTSIIELSILLRRLKEKMYQLMTRDYNTPDSIILFLQVFNKLLLFSMKN